MSFLKKLTSNKRKVSNEGVFTGLKNLFTGGEGSRRLESLLNANENKNVTDKDLKQIIEVLKKLENSKPYSQTLIGQKITKLFFVNENALIKSSEIINYLESTVNSIKGLKDFDKFANSIIAATKRMDEEDIDYYDLYKKSMSMSVGGKDSITGNISIDDVYCYTFDGLVIGYVMQDGFSIGAGTVSNDVVAGKSRYPERPVRVESCKDINSVIKLLSEYVKVYPSILRSIMEKAEKIDSATNKYVRIYDFEDVPKFFKALNKTLLSLAQWTIISYTDPEDKVSNEGLMDYIKGLFSSRNPKLKEITKKMEDTDNLIDLFNEQLDSIKGLDSTNLVNEPISDKRLASIFSKHDNHYTKSTDIVNLVKESVNDFLRLKSIDTFHQQLYKFYEQEWNNVIKTKKPFTNVDGITKLVDKVIGFTSKQDDELITHWGLGNSYLGYVPGNRKFYWRHTESDTSTGNKVEIEPCHDVKSIVVQLTKVTTVIGVLQEKVLAVDGFEILAKKLSSDYKNRNLEGSDVDGVLSSFIEDIISSGYSTEDCYDYLEKQLKCFLLVIAWVKESVTTTSKESLNDLYLSLEADDDEPDESEDGGDNSEDGESSDDTDDEPSENEDNPENEVDGEGSEDTDGTSDNEAGEDSDAPEDYEEKNRIVEPAKDEERRERARSYAVTDKPDEEKIRIKEYLEPICGELINELTLYSAKEVNRPLYHISMNPNIRNFVPQVSKRTLSDEDRSIPRVSTSTSLIGCFNGYQSLVSDMDGRQAKNFNGIFKVYNLPFQYAIKPSRRLLKDVDTSDEYWLVSWKKETYAIHPTVTAEFTVPKIEKIYGSDKASSNYHVYIHVYNGSLYLDHEKKLGQGYYYVTIHGYDYKYPLENNGDNIEVEEIDEKEYRKVTSLSMMVRKK